MQIDNVIAPLSTTLITEQVPRLPSVESDADNAQSLANKMLLANIVVREGNTIFVNCPNSSYFQPQSLSIDGQDFILRLNASGLQYLVRGKSANLAVTLIKKQLDSGHQNICCTIYDGTYYYDFGHELDSHLQFKIVEDIADFIDNQTKLS